MDRLPGGTLTWVALGLGVLAAIRLLILALTPLELGPDEAQYWTWSQRFAFGYFTKPPMIAWLIDLTTSVCGDGEACIRSSAPLLHSGTAFFVFLIGRHLYGVGAGVAAATLFATLPAVWLSAILITTDVALLFFWAAALYAFLKMLTAPSLQWGAVLGASLGLGLLSKYSMGYALIGIALALWLSRTNPRTLLHPGWLTAAALALLILAPNVIWNLENGFATVRHTASNANWGGNLFNLGKFAEFIGSQFGVFGPITMGLLIWGLLTRQWTKAPLVFQRADLILMCFILPALSFIVLQAFISRANANWAAPVYVAAAPLVAAWSLRALRPIWLQVGIGLNVLAGVLFSIAVISPALVAALGQENSVKRLRGWNEHGSALVNMADPARFTAILSDDREDIASLSYYARDRRIPLLAFVPAIGPQHEFHLSVPMRADIQGSVLFVTRRPSPTDVLERFASAQFIAKHTEQLGGGKSRTFNYYTLSTPYTPAYPAP